MQELMDCRIPSLILIEIGNQCTLYACEIWGWVISRESWLKIKQMQKSFIVYNLKIKGNEPYKLPKISWNSS